MSINERLKEARKKLGLTQKEFGARVGVKDTAISKIEKGENSLTEQMLLAICREYGINGTWLKTGNGQMLVATGNNLVSQLAEQCNLDELDCKIIEVYLQLPESHRQIFKNFVLKITESINVSENNIGFTAQDEFSATIQRGEEFTLSPEEQEEAEKFATMAREQYIKSKKQERQPLSVRESGAGNSRGTTNNIIDLGIG